MHERWTLPPPATSVEWNRGCVANVGKFTEALTRLFRCPDVIRMNWSIPFRSCPIYIDRAVIIVNKPPGVVCQLTDDKVAYYLHHYLV